VSEETGKGIDLHGTSDARVWAHEFMRCVGNQPLDEGIMMAWFANSFMAGYDWGKGPLNRDHAESLGEDGSALESARGIAARCWCQPKTEKKTMDVELAEEFAKVLVPLFRKADLCGRMADAIRRYKGCRYDEDPGPYITTLDDLLEEFDREAKK